MRELAELRRSRRPPLPFPQTNTPSSNATENISSSSLESQCNEEYNTKQEEDFMLPSPPSPSEKIPTAENTLVDSSPCTPLSNIDLPPPEEIHELCHTKEDEHDDKEKEKEEDCAKNHDTLKMDICHEPTEPSARDDDDLCNTLTNDNEKQKPVVDMPEISVGYVSQQTTIEGQEEVEKKEKEEEEGPLRPGILPPPTVPLILQNRHPYYSRPKMGIKRRSSLSESSVDNIRQQIPRQKSVKFLQSPTTTTGTITTTSDMIKMIIDDTSNDGTDFTCDDDDASTDESTQRVSSSLSVYLSAMHKLGLDPDGEIDSDVYDPSINSILNDFGSDSTSYSSSLDHDNNKENYNRTHFAKDDTDLLIKSRMSPVLPLCEAERRLQRMKELPKLIQAERAVILQASSALKQCVGIMSKKASSEDISRLRRQLGPGSRVHVEVSKTMLIACQRRQVLMEELALLHQGSPVLVPPPTGDPIRARMKLSAIRLSLKTSNIPNDPTSGGGFVVVDPDLLYSGSVWRGATPSSKSRGDNHHLGQPTCYYLIAIIKCRGEGRLYHSELVTLMHISDLPVGMYRPATYVDLPAKLEIVPLRPNFEFQLEIYCMRTGSDTPMHNHHAYESPRITTTTTTGGGGVTLLHGGVDGNDSELDEPTTRFKFPTPSHKKSLFGHHHNHHHHDHSRHITTTSTTPYSSIDDEDSIVNKPSTPCETAGHVLTYCLPSSSYLKATLTPSKLSEHNSLHTTKRDKIPAFSLISSVEIHYHDDLLVGSNYAVSKQDKSHHTTPTTPTSTIKSSRSTVNSANCLSLRLLRLPRSSPLAGTAGLVDAYVSLEAKVLARGFMTVFEDIGGMGVWQRYWCQLRAGYLHFWKYPEDEYGRGGDGGNSNGGSSSRINNNNKNNPMHNKSSTSNPPLGRIDLRHVVCPPGAMLAPRSICARSNTLYMRSLREIDPTCLSASVNNLSSSSSTLNDKKDKKNKKTKGDTHGGGVDVGASNESLVFRASKDYKWLEQKHLLCADTPEERDAWITWLNGCLDSLRDWMPEHFDCLSRYDARLEFSQPVSSQLGALLIHGSPPAPGISSSSSSSSK
uniref:PH domain-containing protein n=1 Tax=Trichobilharzia regenti TaxID=157069 RepID=A0AA85J535_TRIRE|nr:unnamed protein product [Trichobilharzia regenti]